MGIIIRQSIITTIVSYLGVIIGYINVLWLFPRFLEPDQIGLARVIQDIAILLVPFAQFGMSQSALKFYPVIQKNGGKRGFLTFFLMASAIAYLIFLLILFIFRDPVLSIFSKRSPAVIHFFELSLILTFILIVTGIFESYSRSLFRTVFPNFIKEVLIRFFTAFMILIYFSGFITFQMFLYLLIGGYGLGLICLIIYLLSIGELKISFDLSFLNKDLTKKILSYGLFTFLGSSGFILVMKIDSVMVTSMLGLTEAGIYTTVFYIASVVEMPKRAIVQISAPVIAKAFEESNIMEISNIYRQSSLNQLIIGSLIYIGIWANVENIFHFIPNREVFELGKSVVLIIGLAKLIDMSAGVNGEIIVMSKYYKFNIVSVLLLSVATITANLWLIPLLGINGAAWASTISVLIFNLAKFLFLWIVLKMQPFSKATIKVLAITAFTFYSSGLIPFPENVIADIAIRSVYIAAIYSFLIIYFKISPEVDNLFNAIIRRFRNF